jgi:ribosome-binding factor A
MATIRQQRVANLLFEELSILIGHELSDPRLTLVNVTGVQISKDLRNAKVFVHHADDDRSRQDVLEGLQHATPFLRGQVAERCGLRMVPELLFSYDDTPEKAARVDQLLEQIAEERTEQPGREDAPEQAGDEAT